MDVSKLGQKPPEKFTNTEAAWTSWSFDYRNYLAAANPAARPALLFAEKAGDAPLTEDDVAARGWAVISEQLYSSLVGFTQGESKSILRNTKEGFGLEAWRRLAKRWHKSQAQSRVADKESLMANAAVSDDRLGQAVEG